MAAQRRSQFTPSVAWNWHLLVIAILLRSILYNGVIAASGTHIVEVSQMGALQTPAVMRFSPNCSAVKHAFVAKGIDANDIPAKRNHEMVLRYCETSTVGTCCTNAMEAKLALQSRLHLEKQSRELITKLSATLSAKAHKFNDIFQTLLLESKKEFHNMFTRTYGVIYQRNSYVFSDLFNELEDYYDRGRLDLIEVMEKFFNTLYQKMFQVLNSQYSFDAKYLVCVSKHMKELKPFGDVPDKLSVQIKRSFVATRTYGHALATAAEIIKKLNNVRMNADCTVALTRMQHCGLCNGYVQKPCLNYCLNVVKGCLHHFNEVDTEWDNYTTAMDKVAERLLGSFNIVMVVEPINIKISEAIMNFQDSGPDITSRVFQGCGRPTLNRQSRTVDHKRSSVLSDSNVVRKRSIMESHYNAWDGDTLDIDAALENVVIQREKRASDPNVSTIHKLSDKRSVDAYNGNENTRRKKKKKPQYHHGKNNLENSGRDPILDKLIKDIRHRIKEAKHFWSNMPYQICNNGEMSAPAIVDNMCWNGHTIDRYPHSIHLGHGKNPEFEADPSTARQMSIVASQLYYVRNIIGLLKNAYNGQDVDFNTEGDDNYGSGSGSGNGTDDDADDNESSGLGVSSFASNKDAVEVTNRPSPGDDEDDKDNNKIFVHTSQPKYIDNAIDDKQETNSIEDINLDSSGSREYHNSPMTLRRALVMYLLPLYMAWFGGLCVDLL